MDPLIAGQTGSNTIHGPGTPGGAGSVSAAVAAFLGPMRCADDAATRPGDSHAGRLRSRLGALLSDGASVSSDAPTAARDSRTGLPSLALPRRKPPTAE